MSKEISKRKILVYAHWQGMHEPVLMGVLNTELLRGKEIFSFEYDKQWLKSPYAQWLDPDLQLFSGPQYLNDDHKANFGLFLDSSPDRWGRVLMRRREAALARLENRVEKKLLEADYLLGVFDDHRVGALRFKEVFDGPFLSNEKEISVPPWTSIRELEEISLRLEQDDAVEDVGYLKWLNMIIAPGASLGGARPKASVVDTKGQLWIAKFPSRADQFDMGGWEIVVAELAVMAGINMASSFAKKYSNPHHTFITKRFDRTPNGERLHFASAMTVLGYLDGKDHDDGISYLELVEFILSNGADINLNLEELWRRIVFNICISNTDDHLRNHGFLMTPHGWVLSPAFDMNPVETGTGLKLNISETDNALELDLALEVSTYFRLNVDRANQTISEVKSAVKQWRKVAGKYKLSKTEQDLKAMAFSRAE